MKFLCAEIQCPSWKYDFGHIFKITRKCCWNEKRCCVRIRKKYGTMIHIHHKKHFAKKMNTTMVDPVAGSNGMDILNLVAPPLANAFQWPTFVLHRSWRWTAMDGGRGHGRCHPWWCVCMCVCLSQGHTKTVGLHSKSYKNSTNHKNSNKKRSYIQCRVQHALVELP